MAIKTKVVRGREFNAEEEARFSTKLLECLTNELTIDSTEVDKDGNTLRTWATLEAANEWVAFANTFEPPPVSAEVITE